MCNRWDYIDTLNALLQDMDEAGYRVEIGNGYYLAAVDSSAFGGSIQAVIFANTDDDEEEELENERE